MAEARLRLRPTKVPWNRRRLNTLEGLKESAAHTGSHFFDAATMRFFGSRAHDPYSVRGTDGSAAVFVTSEQDRTGFGRLGQVWNGRRLYTVRLARFIRGRVEIDTVGDFGAYKTSRAADKAARRLAGWA